MSATKNRQEQTFSVGYFGGTDVLRFICATGVIFHHATQSLRNKDVITNSELIHRHSGEFFLDVFFIISGFLISLILMKEYETNTFSLKNFYMRRIIRIWPLYFLAVLVKIVIAPSMNGTPPGMIVTNLIHALTFSINFQLAFSEVVKTYTILWSICIEEHIYLLLPFLISVFKHKFKSLSIFLLITGVLSWMFFLSIPAKEGVSIPYFMSTSYFYYFGIGMLIACIRNGLIAGKKLETFLFRPLVQVVVMLVFFSYVFNFWGIQRMVALTLLMNGAFGGYLVWASTKENFIFMLKPKLSRYMGNISYAMYVSHVITIGAAIALFKKKHVPFSEGAWGWGLPLLAVLLCVGLSTLLYYYFERPILKFKNRFTSVANK